MIDLTAGIWLLVQCTPSRAVFDVMRPVVIYVMCTASYIPSPSTFIGFFENAIEEESVAMNLTQKR